MLIGRAERDVVFTNGDAAVMFDTEFLEGEAKRFNRGFTGVGRFNF